MKTFVYVIVFALTASFSACCNDDDDVCLRPASPLVMPALRATSGTSALYNGYLEVWPCYENSSMYFGNYTAAGALTAINPYYMVDSGKPAGASYPVRLPIGAYTMVYWGFPSLTTDTAGLVRYPALSINTNLANGSFALLATAGDTTYRPSYEMVHATQQVAIGTDSLHAQLQRATALFGVAVQNQDGTTLSTSIDSMWVHIGGIASGLNAYTAAPSAQTCTVAVPLTKNAAGTQWMCSDISLFPSTAYPLMQLYILLENGTRTVFAQALTNALTAGTSTTVTLLLNGTLSTENRTGTFTVVDWTEQTENIEVPLM